MNLKCCKRWILGNDFLISIKAVIDFSKRVLDTIRILGIKVIQKRVSSRDTEVRVNTCSEREHDESEERIWENSCLLYTSRCV